MIAAIPLLFDRPDVDWHYSQSRYVRNEYQFAHQWIRDNHENLRRYLILSRGTMAGFFVLGFGLSGNGPVGFIAGVLVRSPPCCGLSIAN